MPSILIYPCRKAMSPADGHHGHKRLRQTLISCTKDQARMIRLNLHVKANDMLESFCGTHEIRRSAAVCLFIAFVLTDRQNTQRFIDFVNGCEMTKLFPVKHTRRRRSTRLSHE